MTWEEWISMHPTYLSITWVGVLGIIICAGILIAAILDFDSEVGVGFPVYITLTFTCGFVFFVLNTVYIIGVEIPNSEYRYTTYIESVEPTDLDIVAIEYSNGNYNILYEDDHNDLQTINNAIVEFGSHNIKASAKIVRGMNVEGIEELIEPILYLRSEKDIDSITEKNVAKIEDLH